MRFYTDSSRPPPLIRPIAAGRPRAAPGKITGPGSRDGFAAAMHRRESGCCVLIRLLASLALLCLMPLDGVRAQQELPPTTFHWAYAATFGTGVYRLGDDSEVLVLQAPISWTLREPGEKEEKPFGIRLLLPVTVGVEKFDLSDFLAGMFPDRFEQVSFLPGVELEFPRSERWRLKVRSQAGWGTQLGSGDDSAWIYTLGVRSRYEWPAAAGHPAWISGVLWSGYKRNAGKRESLARLTNGVEFDLPLSRWRFRGERMHLMPHVLGDWYFNTADFFSLSEDVFKQLDWEWEIGLSAGRDRPFSVFKKEFERIGFALRYSDDSAGIRFFLNSVF